uniref:Uncharacterized protein n=1 Tax=Anguilla anguilla TaxID=7936 RepID=A0A0E9WH98_ANGAN
MKMEMDTFLYRAKDVKACTWGKKGNQMFSTLKYREIICLFVSFLLLLVIKKVFSLLSNSL